MAQLTRRSRPVRTLIVLATLIVALFGALIAGTTWSDATLTPKLALDLEGGTQIILRPVADNNVAITDKTITEAINVIRQRVDSSGVAEAEITSQGSNNIVVGLPGKPSEETLKLVRTSAQMEFRPVLVIGAPAPAAAPTPTPTAGATPAATDAASPTPSATATAAPSDTPTTAAPTSPSDAAYYVTPKVQADYDALDCTDKANLTGGSVNPQDKALVTCDPAGTAKYILGPVEIQGKEIDSASSGLGVGPNGTVTNKWVVNIRFGSTGSGQFRTVTQRLQGLAATPPLNQFAMVLDGLVISAPSLASGVVITDGKAEISGSFTRDSAASLANQLNFGALPLTFTVQSEERISATLGSTQLMHGLIAGLIGLVLVVIYSLFQYRVLGFVTVASLGLAGTITYGVITVLSWTQGYRLSLPGVAGLIVAIGVTADSFIVYFERIRDELRDGRTLVAAIEQGWARARRTIVASDAVNFLAAIVLYFLAVGGVRGFAFTLGLTTIIDLVVVFFFTHPLLGVLSRTEFFSGGHPASGLDPRRLGAPVTRYVGRGRVATGSRTAPASPAVQQDAPVAEPGYVPVGAGTPKQTIAERRAAARAAAGPSTEPAGPAGPQDAPPGGAATRPGTEPTSGRTEGGEL